MVYYPIYGGRQVCHSKSCKRRADGQDQYLQSVVSAVKDVEGLNHQFLFNLYHKYALSSRLQYLKLMNSDRFISPLTLKSVPASHLPTPIKETDEAPEGTVKSILPCTPLAIVKVLEHLGVYNKMLNYGDRARGKVITVINR